MSRNSKDKRDRKRAKQRQQQNQKAAQSAKPDAAESLLEHERDRYMREWGVTAQKFEADGHYEWMAERLAGHRLVLEVGTGTGQSTAALLAAGHRVVSIGENPACLDVAESRLRSLGHHVVRVGREHIHSIDARTYGVSYPSPTELGLTTIPEVGALLIEGDTINDPSLIA